MLTPLCYLLSVVSDPMRCIPEQCMRSEGFLHFLITDVAHLTHVAHGTEELNLV